MRWKATALLLTVVLTTAVIVGCSGENPLDPDRPRRNVATGVGGLAPLDVQQDDGNKPAPPPPPPGGNSNTQEQGNAVAPPPPPPPTNNADTSTEPDDEGVRSKAVAGDNVGRKGRNYGGGIITTPIAAYFSVRDRIVMQQVEYALKLFKAEHGRVPESHEEFMEKIIEANTIKLPELLRQDEKYVYDPQQGMLMVESKR